MANRKRRHLALVIALDLGGTKLASALVTGEGRVWKAWSAPTDVSSGRACLDQLLASARRARRLAGCRIRQDSGRLSGGLRRRRRDRGWRLQRADRDKKKKNGQRSEKRCFPHDSMPVMESCSCLLECSSLTPFGPRHTVLRHACNQGWLRQHPYRYSRYLTRILRNFFSPA